MLCVVKCLKEKPKLQSSAKYVSTFINTRTRVDFFFFFLSFFFLSFLGFFFFFFLFFFFSFKLEDYVDANMY